MFVRPSFQPNFLVRQSGTALTTGQMGLCIRLLSLVLVGVAISAILLDYVTGWQSRLLHEGAELKTNPLTIFLIFLTLAAICLQRPLHLPSPLEKTLWTIVIAVASLYPFSGTASEYLWPEAALGQTGWNTALCFGLIALGQLTRGYQPTFGLFLTACALVPLMVAMNGFLLNAYDFHGHMCLTTVMALTGLWSANLFSFVRNKYVRLTLQPSIPGRLLRMQLAVWLLFDMGVLLAIRPLEDLPGHRVLALASAFGVIVSWLMMSYFSLRFVNLLDRAKRNERMLSGEVSRDPLTGLANRRAAISHFENHAGRQKMGVLLIDIDHFKSINDTYGHNVGDFTLTQVANALRNTLRVSDMVARWGGEEFLVVCPCPKPADVITVAEHLRHAVAEIPLPRNNGGRVTVSVGATWIPMSAPPTMEAAVHQADIALYEAKNTGRDKCRLFGVTKPQARSEGDRDRTATSELSQTTGLEPRLTA